jgi:hypothetical protein
MGVSSDSHPGLAGDTALVVVAHVDPEDLSILQRPPKPLTTSEPSHPRLFPRFVSDIHQGASYHNAGAGGNHLSGSRHTKALAGWLRSSLPPRAFLWADGS